MSPGVLGPSPTASDLGDHGQVTELLCTSAHTPSEDPLEEKVNRPHFLLQPVPL